MKYILYLLLLLCSFNLVQAQIEQYFPPALGPILAYKGAVNGFNNPQGRKNGIAFNNIPDVGATAYIPLHFVNNLGLYVNLMYNTNTFLMKYNYDGINKKYINNDKMRFSYVSLEPIFSHVGFMLGLGINIPVYADWEEVTINTERLNTVYEIKAGYTYPFYFDNIGRFNAYIKASYALNGIYNNFKEDDPLKDIVPAIPPQIITNYYNPRPASVQIGVNFLFNLIILPQEYYE